MRSSDRTRSAAALRPIDTVGQQLGNDLNQPTAEHPRPKVDITNRFPQGLFPPPTPFTGVLWYMDPHFENPYSQQWNLGLQHQLDEPTATTANDVGSASSLLNIGGYCNTAVEPEPGPIKPRTPFPHARQSFFDRNWGKSNYHAFQFLLDKTAASGLAYQSLLHLVPLDGPRLVRLVRGRRFRHAESVQPPGRLLAIGLRRPPRAQRELGVAAAVRFRPKVGSGQPYTLSIPGDITNTGNTGNYARPNTNILGAVAVSNPTPARSIDTSMVGWPDFVPGTSVRQYGNSGRHNVRTDGVSNFDLSLFRQFPFMESKFVEFRLQVFNAFNTPTFGTPERLFSQPNFGIVSSTALPERNIQDETEGSLLSRRGIGRSVSGLLGSACCLGAYCESRTGSNEVLEPGERP